MSQRYPMIAVPEVEHERGGNNLANKRALRLWQAAKRIVTRRHGLTIDKIKVEPDPTVLGNFGFHSSVFAVAGANRTRDVSGCFEVRVSQLTGAVRISPVVYTETTLFPEIPYKRVKPAEVPHALRQFARALSRS